MGRRKKPIAYWSTPIQLLTFFGTLEGLHSGLVCVGEEMGLLTLASTSRSGTLLADSVLHFLTDVGVYKNNKSKLSNCPFVLCPSYLVYYYVHRLNH